MASLVHQFQKDATQSGKSVIELLRTAKMIAVKLGLSDIDEWVNAELGGYANSKLVPEYRKITGGNLQIFNPYRGQWIPVGALDRVFPVTQQVSEIEELAECESVVISLTRKDNYGMHTDMGDDVTDWQQQISISAVQLKGLLEAVRNKLLDWSLELEKRGILGGDMSFNEKERASAHTQTFHIQNFTGVLGSVSNSGSNSRTNIGSTDQSRNTAERAKVIKKLRKLNRDQVPEVDQAKIEERIDELENAAADKSKFQEAYFKFIAAVADHMQVFGPMIPVITALVQR